MPDAGMRHAGHEAEGGNVRALIVLSLVMSFSACTFTGPTLPPGYDASHGHQVPGDRR